MRSISACSVFVMTQHELRRASTHAAEQSDGMDSTNRQAAWASDPRWARAKEHAMRDEVLHALERAQNQEEAHAAAHLFLRWLEELEMIE